MARLILLYFLSSIKASFGNGRNGVWILLTIDSRGYTFVFPFLAVILSLRRHLHICANFQSKDLFTIQQRESFSFLSDRHNDSEFSTFCCYYYFCYTNLLKLHSKNRRDQLQNYSIVGQDTYLIFVLICTSYLLAHYREVCEVVLKKNASKASPYVHTQSLFSKKHFSYTKISLHSTYVHISHVPDGITSWKVSGHLAVLACHNRPT